MICPMCNGNGYIDNGTPDMKTRFGYECPNCNHGTYIPIMLCDDCGEEWSYNNDRLCPYCSSENFKEWRKNA